MSNRIIQEKADSLRVIDDTLFRLIASRREVCQEILRTLLESPDLVVHQVTVQAVMSGLHREVTLDALCELPEGIWINVEMQKGRQHDDIRRTRFHAAAVTMNRTPKGTGFSDIPDVTVIYITEYDALHNGQIFTEVRRCQAVGESMIPLEDGERICFVNTAVDDGSERAELMRLFLKREVFEHEKFQELSKAVRYFKGSEKGRGEMCAVIEEYGMEQREEGREEGRAEMRSIVEEYGIAQREEGRIEGEKRLTSLISILMEQGDLQNMKKVIADKEYRESLYMQYAI